MSYSKLVALILFVLVNFVLIYAGHERPPKIKERYNLASFTLTMLGIAVVVLYVLDRYEFISTNFRIFDWF